MVNETNIKDAAGNAAIVIEFLEGKLCRDSYHPIW
jgi:hypothetical protein